MNCKLLRQHKGKGFGKNLVKELEKLCQFSDMEKIVLTVLKGLFSFPSFLTHAFTAFSSANTKAVAFYKAVG